MALFVASCKQQREQITRFFFILPATPNDSADNGN